MQSSCLAQLLPRIPVPLSLAPTQQICRLLPELTKAVQVPAQGRPVMFGHLTQPEVVPQSPVLALHGASLKQ